MTEEWQKEPRSVVEKLIERGSLYDIETMEKIYDEDQYIIFIEPDGSVRRTGRADIMALFGGWAAESAAPLLPEADFLHVEATSDEAVILLRRRMQADAPSNLYELRMRKRADAWVVVGETVMPWVITGE
jgi:hypothetical protein